MILLTSIKIHLLFFFLKKKNTTRVSVRRNVCIGTMITTDQPEKEVWENHKAFKVGDLVRDLKAPLRSLKKTAHNLFFSFSSLFNIANDANSLQVNAQIKKILPCGMILKLKNSPISGLSHISQV